MYLFTTNYERFDVFFWCLEDCSCTILCCSECCFEVICKFMWTKHFGESDGLQPKSDGLLQPASDGLQPSSDGFQPTAFQTVFSLPLLKAAPVRLVRWHGSREHPFCRRCSLSSGGSAPPRASSVFCVPKRRACRTLPKWKDPMAARAAIHLRGNYEVGDMLGEGQKLCSL